MNADRFFIAIVLGMLPILWLPRFALPYATAVALSIFLLGIWRKKFSLILLGGLLAWSYAQVEQMAKNAENPPAHNAQTTFKITQLLKQTDYQTAIAQLDSGEPIFLNWQSETPLILEQHYRANLRLRPISGRLNIGNVNRQKWYFAQHLHAIGTVKQAEMLAEQPTAWRTQWLSRTQRFTATLPNQGLLLALAFGERAWLKQADWTVFQRTSTAHLIAISGLHIALAFGFGLGLARGVLWIIGHFGGLQAVRSPLIFAKCCGALFALGYSYLAGFAIPTQRALLAIFCLLALQQLRRHYTEWQLWWRVVAILLLFDPLAILSDSFWLSILAVASLIFWYQHFPLRRFCNISHKFTRLLAGIFHLQIGILLVFTPVQCYFFEGISPWAFVANLGIVPLYSLLLIPLILFSLLTDNVLHTWQLADWIAQGSLAVLRPLAEDWINLSTEAQWQLISLNGLVLWSIYFWLNRKPKWRYGLFGVLGFQGLFYLSLLGQPRAQWIMFDVEQGLAMALVERQRAVMFDSGASWGNLSMAKLEILPYLQRKGITLDTIFLSHDDNDHSGGIADLLTAFPQATLISAGQKSYANHTPQACQAGKTWQFGAFHLRALHPKVPQPRAKNADSCTLLVEIEGVKILLTGDLGAAEERQIARSVGKIDFLQVGHHGSKTSTSETLLNVAQPHTALISVGRFNPWKMPHSAVRKRLENHHILQMDTAQTGMIVVNFDENDWEIKIARHKWSAWYAGIY